MGARDETGEVFELGEAANGLVGWELVVVEIKNGLWLELAEVEKVELKRLLPRLGAAG